MPILKVDLCGWVYNNIVLSLRLCQDCTFAYPGGKEVQPLTAKQHLCINSIPNTFWTVSVLSIHFNYELDEKFARDKLMFRL